MAQLEILHHPDPRLRKKAAPVGEVNTATRQIVEDMFATMYANKGIGLAATQVNVHQRIITIDVSEDKTEPLCLINPEILSKEGSIEHEEGCLSVPDFYEKVTRAERIRVRALDRDGNVFERDADGLLAICIQHEMDHLEGKLFVDYLSTLKQQRARKVVQKWEKEHAKRATRAATA
ncbi:peptide deformylase [Thiothrix nivea]|uniref:Peptide deformylase n=1 Tax=Thiothrix nivea (strain ATCC 35100 / DSM 5205 / JP2) TaxID=870187 RepID=A0A656HI55_THINJ|nr:peptide deformylase [Thiothrix nivea]EIJ35060.1 peptide deformylase [Thiothrix nivea DSM 5205]